MTRAWRFVRADLLLACAASLAVVALYAPWIAQPHLRYDDFGFLTTARTWSETRANLFVPMNEHVMPMARFAAGVLVSLTPQQSRLPAHAQIQGVLAVIAGMWLLFAFVRRELGHSFYAVVAMVAWGVTSTYYECVTWYSASFFTLALDLTLAALLAAQTYVRRRRQSALLACALFCMGAVAFHSTAILAGVWCGWYIFLGQRAHSPAVPWPQRAFAAAAPALGTIAFSAFALLAAGHKVLGASHYRGKTIFAAFDVREGVENTLRTIVDNQVPGAFGLWHKFWVVPFPAVLAICAVLAVTAALWWRVAPHRRMLALGLAVLVTSNLIVYGARADWSYERSVHNWTRYHLFPHLGLVLFVVGGLPYFAGRWFVLTSPRLSRRQTIALGGLIAVALLVHWPRTHRSHFFFPSQIEILRRVERVDRYCRLAAIDGETARQGLPFVHFPLGYPDDNAWDFLRGSSSPVPASVEAVRRQLQAIR